MNVGVSMWENRPRAILAARGIAVIPPGGTRPTLKIAGFDLAEG